MRTDPASDAKGFPDNGQLSYLSPIECSLAMGLDRDVNRHTVLLGEGQEGLQLAEE